MIIASSRLSSKPKEASRTRFQIFCLSVEFKTDKVGGFTDTLLSKVSVVGLQFLYADDVHQLLK